MERQLAQLAVDTVIRFRYPAANYSVARVRRLESRTLLIEEVRDLHVEPLDPMTAVLDPTLCRDRYLVTGRDLDKNARRSFYLGSMVELEIASAAPTQAAVWIDTDDDWSPAEAEPPAEYRLAGVLADAMPGVVARLIADAANALMGRLGSVGRWAIVIDQATLDAMSQ